MIPRSTGYHYAHYPNVVTSLEFERILSASGPFAGHLVRPSDHKEPKKIAWLQCVGSRDLNHCDNSYCSSVCCMYAIKQAVIAKEHCKTYHPGRHHLLHGHAHPSGRTSRSITGGPKRNTASASSAPGSTASIPSRAPTTSHPLSARKHGEMKVEDFDMVVLSVGLETSARTP